MQGISLTVSRLLRLHRPQLAQQNFQLVLPHLPRYICTSQALMKKFATFEEAVDNSTSAPAASNQDKLKLYGLYKQATVGKVNTKKPGMMDLVGKAKWEAWSELGDKSKDEAKSEYIEMINSLFESAGGGGSAGSAPKASKEDGDGVMITIENGIKTITLCRPTKKNALTTEMYAALTKALNEANDDPNTNIVVLTGQGDFFTSGNDLSNFTSIKMTDVPQMAATARGILQTYIASYIDCKKPLIALLNGSAVGIGVTVLGLCDIVYATDKAIFTTPFSSLGQSPEGCSSYTFPRVMGYAKASELLLFNSKITSKEAEACGLITKVFPDDRLQAEAWQRINAMAKLPVKSLIYSKELIRGRERAKLHEINAAECTRLEERWQSEDCMNAVMTFFTKKAKI